MRIAIMFILFSLVSCGYNEKAEGVLHGILNLKKLDNISFRIENKEGEVCDYTQIITKIDNFKSQDLIHDLANTKGNVLEIYIPPKKLQPDEKAYMAIVTNIESTPIIFTVESSVDVILNGGVSHFPLTLKSGVTKITLSLKKDKLLLHTTNTPLAKAMLKTPQTKTK